MFTSEIPVHIVSELWGVQYTQWNIYLQRWFKRQTQLTSWNVREFIYSVYHLCYSSLISKGSLFRVCPLWVSLFLFCFCLAHIAYSTIMTRNLACTYELVLSQRWTAKSHASSSVCSEQDRNWMKICSQLIMHVLTVFCFPTYRSEMVMFVFFVFVQGHKTFSRILLFVYCIIRIYHSDHHNCERRSW